jgi:hypothetical protein
MAPNYGKTPPILIEFVIFAHSNCKNLAVDLQCLDPQYDMITMFCIKTQIEPIHKFHAETG